MKHPEFIYAANAKFCQATTDEGFTIIDEAPEILEKLPENTYIAQRQQLDFQVNEGVSYIGNRDYLQLLPYVVVVTEGTVLTADTKVFVYQRVKGTSENRLLGNVSIGIGGHIDMIDTVISNDYENESAVDVVGTIINSTRRELAEELKALIPGEEDFHPFDAPIRFVGFMRDTTNEVGNLHFGIICLASAEGYTLSGNEDQINSLDPMTPRELISSDLPLENWTRILCEWLVNNQ